MSAAYENLMLMKKRRMNIYFEAETEIYCTICEVSAFHQALNEVCYGIKVFDFDLLIGAPRAEAIKLMGKMSPLLNDTATENVRRLTGHRPYRFVIQPEGYEFDLNLREIGIIRASLAEALARIHKGDFEVRFPMDVSECQALVEDLSRVIKREESHTGEHSERNGQAIRLARKKEMEEEITWHLNRMGRTLPRRDALKFAYDFDAVFRQAYKECAAMGWDYASSMKTLYQHLLDARAFAESGLRRSYDDTFVLSYIPEKAIPPSVCRLWGMGVAISLGGMLQTSARKDIAKTLQQAEPLIRLGLRKAQKRQTDEAVSEDWADQIADTVSLMATAVAKASGE